MTDSMEPTHATFGDPSEHVPSWQETSDELKNAEMYWFTTLRNGIPHTVPIIGDWDGKQFTMCCPRAEQKARNIGVNPTVQVLTGHSVLSPGLDVVIHGEAEEIEGQGRLDYGAAMAAKYDEPWRFEGTEESMVVYAIKPQTIYAFHRFDPITSARWDLDGDGDEG